jgi:hypothetical protein
MPTLVLFILTDILTVMNAVGTGKIKVNWR